MGKEEVLIKDPQSSGEAPALGGFGSGALSLTFASFSLVYKLQEVLTLSLRSSLPPTHKHTDHTRPPPTSFQVRLPLFTSINGSSPQNARV